MARNMRYLFLLFPVLLKAQAIPLAPPRIQSESVFFLKETAVELAFDLDSASIHYALNSTPTAQSPVYTKPITIKETTALNAVATHPDYLMSAVAGKRFVKVKYVPNVVQLLTLPNKNYPGRGAASLYDLKKGSTDLHDGNWIGFLGDTVVVESTFKRKINCNQLQISTLSDLNAWILTMKSFTVFGKNKQGVWQNIGSWQAPADDILATAATYDSFQTVILQPLSTREIRIEIIPFGPLPKEHPGAGQPAWLFLDEIVFQ
jgi:hypothetical protein